MAGLASTGAGADMIDGARSVGLEFAQTTARKGTADDERHISGRVLRRLSGAVAGPPDQRLPVVRGDPDPDRARGGLGRRSLVHLQQRRRKDRRRGRPAVPGAPAADPVQAEVPALVVQLEPRAAALQQPGGRLPRPDGRPLPLHRRAAGGPPGDPLSRRGAPEPVASPGQVAAGHPPLHRAALPRHRRAGLGGGGLVRDPVHRQVPARAVRLRRGRVPVAQPGHRLRAHPGHRPVPALQPATVTELDHAPIAELAGRDYVALLEPLWSYLTVSDAPVPGEVIFAFGCGNLRVPQRAANLQLDGWAPHVLVTGGVGRRTAELFGASEAAVFARHLRWLGVAASAIVTEDRAGNTGENVTLGMRALRRRGVEVRRALLVAKPVCTRRCASTLRLRHPRVETVCCPCRGRRSRPPRRSAGCSAPPAPGPGAAPTGRPGPSARPTRADRGAAPQRCWPTARTTGSPLREGSGWLIRSRSGMRSSKRAPPAWCASVSTSSPPCASASCLAMYSPSPSPLRPLPSWVKRSKMRPCSSGAIPAPSSSTASTAWPPLRSAISRTSRSSGEYLQALSSRLPRIWRTASGATRTGRLPSHSTRIGWSRWPAWASVAA